MKQTSFFDTWSSLAGGGLGRAVQSVERATPEAVRTALKTIPAASDGFLALLSPAADAEIEKIEGAARQLTAQRFGHVVNLYIPLYLTNHCINNCSYCWFGKDNEIVRKTLTLDEVAREGERLLTEGYRSVLLVAGESKKEAPLAYIEKAIRLMKRMGFVFVGIETQTWSEDAYRRLGGAGLDSVTVYQETYDTSVYERVHPAGPKSDFSWRIETPDRIARAGIRSVGLGILLGLGDFYRDVVSLASHVKYMQKQYWQTMVSISFPRIHAYPAGFRNGRNVSDAQLIRMILAMRLAFPDATLTLSTRETAQLRDRLFGAGINQVSAGSKTSPGAYTAEGEQAHAGEQFPVEDGRPPEAVVAAIRGKGLEWVWKDWDVNLKPVSDRD